MQSLENHLRGIKANICAAETGVQSLSILFNIGLSLNFSNPQHPTPFKSKTTVREFCDAFRRDWVVRQTYFIYGMICAPLSETTMSSFGSWQLAFFYEITYNFIHHNISSICNGHDPCSPSRPNTPFDTARQQCKENYLNRQNIVPSQQNTNKNLLDGFLNLLKK